MISLDCSSIYPVLAVCIFAMAVLVLDLFLPRDNKKLAFLASLLGLVVSAGTLWKLMGTNASGLGGAIIADDFALVFQLLLLVVAALSILLSEKYIQMCLVFNSSEERFKHNAEHLNNKVATK